MESCLPHLLHSKALAAPLNVNNLCEVFTRHSRQPHHEPTPLEAELLGALKQALVALGKEHDGTDFEADCAACHSYLDGRAVIAKAEAQQSSATMPQADAQEASLRMLLGEVRYERHRQDLKWGGPDHDDRHTTAEFVEFIEGYVGRARMLASNPGRARRRLVQVAALALAACECIDRASRVEPQNVKEVT